MKDCDFVVGVREEILDQNYETYRSLFSKTQLKDATDLYWQEALWFFEALDQSSQEVLFRIIRQVIVDTISSFFAVLDGVAGLPQQSGDFELTLAGQKLNGDLQDLFLEMEEKNRPGNA